MTTPTLASCIPYQCGADPFNYAARYACSNAGFEGSRSCLDPECAPYCPNASVTPAVQAAAVALKFQPKLTATNLQKPIPAITAPLRAIQLPNLSPLCELNAMIGQHPVIATVVLVGVFAMFSGGKKRGRR
jgi:hypothetical protein